MTIRRLPLLHAGRARPQTTKSGGQCRASIPSATHCVRGALQIRVAATTPQARLACGLIRAELATSRHASPAMNRSAVRLGRKQ